MPHSLYQTFYHLVWTTKHKQNLIDEKVENILRAYILNKIIKLGCQCLAINMTQDHIHLLSMIKPSISPAEFVNKIKGASSHEINQLISSKNFKWQKGYGVLTLSQKGIPFVKEYIKKQKEHHKNNTIIPILEQIPDDEDD